MWSVQLQKENSKFDLRSTRYKLEPYAWRSLPLVLLALLQTSIEFCSLGCMVLDWPEAFEMFFWLGIEIEHQFTNEIIDYKA